MNQKDKALLNLLQFELPVNESPFQAIADQLGWSEAEVYRRIRKLKEQKIIRRIGGVLEAKKIKHQSVLAAARVPPAKIKSVAGIMAGYREVTHSYLRSHQYNVWFTITSTSAARVKKIAGEIQAAAGIDDVYLLPALKKYKIDTRFRV